MEDQPKLKRLRKLVASEVSLVNRGAVRRPFLIVKNKDGTVPENAQRDLFAITPEQDARIDAVIRKAGNFDESKHPRADNGEFGSGGGGGGGHENDSKGKGGGAGDSGGGKGSESSGSGGVQAGLTAAESKARGIRHNPHFDAGGKFDGSPEGKKNMEAAWVASAKASKKAEDLGSEPYANGLSPEDKRKAHLAAADAHTEAAAIGDEMHPYRRSEVAAHKKTAKLHRRFADESVQKSARRRIAKDLGDDAAGPTDGAPDETAPDTTDDGIDDNMPDERSMAALKAVYRILLPFKGQITEDMVDDVLAELDLDDTGEDGQDDDDAADDEDVEGKTDDINEEETAMAKGDEMPEELKEKFNKAASWTPAQPEGMSDEDYNKAVAAAKAAFSGACSKDAGDDEDEDEDDNDVKKNVKKSALPQHAELVAKAQAEKAQWIAKAADLEARLGKMETERVLKSHEDDIRRDCEILGRDPVDQARILKSAFEANEETGKAFRSLLAESARLSREGGVFKSVGTSSNASFGAYVPSTGQGSPRAQLEAMVKGLVQKGETKDEAAAWASVLNTSRGQELYAADRNGSH